MCHLQGDVFRQRDGKCTSFHTNSNSDCRNDRLWRMMSHIYLLVFLHIVQVCLLTNAEIEKFLPLVSNSIFLSLEMEHHVMS